MPPGEGGKSKSAMPRFQGCLRMSEPILRMPRPAENVSSFSPPSALLDPVPRQMFVPGERPGCAPKSPRGKGACASYSRCFPGGSSDRAAAAHRTRASAFFRTFCPSPGTHCFQRASILLINAAFCQGECAPQLAGDEGSCYCPRERPCRPISSEGEIEWMKGVSTSSRLKR